jgi:hypothetical protein
MKKIKLHPELKHQLVDEFGVTMQTVSMSLAHVFNSDQAKRIRKRAKELLEKEAKQIVEE